MFPANHNPLSADGHNLASCFCEKKDIILVSIVEEDQKSHATMVLEPVTSGHWSLVFLEYPNKSGEHKMLVAAHGLNGLFKLVERETVFVEPEKAMQAFADKVHLFDQKPAPPPKLAE